MNQIDRLNKPLAGWHALLLLFVAFLPYPTALLGSGAGTPWLAASSRCRCSG
jgi:uncharacterized membrane protein